MQGGLPFSGHILGIAQNLKLQYTRLPVKYKVQTAQIQVNFWYFDDSNDCVDIIDDYLV